MYDPRIEGHIHVGVMTGLAILAWVYIGHFLIRTWAGLKSSNPALQGLAYGM